jgi:hypothetical protein
MVKRKKTLKEEYHLQKTELSYFKYNSFWNFLLRSKSWNIKKYNNENVRNIIWCKGRDIKLRR